MPAFFLINFLQSKYLKVKLNKPIGRCSRYNLKQLHAFIYVSLLYLRFECSTTIPDRDNYHHSDLMAHTVCNSHLLTLQVPRWFLNRVH